MSLKAKLMKIENELDMLYTRDPDSPRIAELEAQADEISEEITAAEDALKRNQELREIEQRELRFKERITSKHGDFTDWWKWAESLYTITQDEETKQFTVNSNARDWKSEMSWGPFNTKIDAIEKIEDLINYKINDRNRGRGSMQDDLKN